MKTGTNIRDIHEIIDLAFEHKKEVLTTDPATGNFIKNTSPQITKRYIGKHPISIITQKRSPLAMSSRIKITGTLNLQLEDPTVPKSKKLSKKKAIKFIKT